MEKRYKKTCSILGHNLESPDASCLRIFGRNLQPPAGGYVRLGGSLFCSGLDQGGSTLVGRMVTYSVVWLASRMWDLARNLASPYQGRD